jgi:hypothetical protein
MKKSIIVLSLFVSTLQLQAQTSSFGAKIGLNSSILSGTVNMEPDYKSGLMMGIYLDGAVSKRFHIQPELFYSSQGAKISYRNGGTTTQLSYINLPVVAKLYLGSVLNLQLGPQIGFLVSATDKGKVNGTTVNDDLMDIFNGMDFSLATGIGLDFPGGVNVGARLVFGLSNINKDRGYIAPGITRPPLTNGVIQFALGVPLAKF